MGILLTMRSLPRSRVRVRVPRDPRPCRSCFLSSWAQELRSHHRGVDTLRWIGCGLHSDNGGVPGAKITESSNRFFAAGVPPGWRTFTVPNVALDAGTYWIAIHTGATGQLLRDYRGDGNSDAFFSGAVDPFGTGTAGTGTLSVYATYTVGQ